MHTTTQPEGGPAMITARTARTTTPAAQAPADSGLRLARLVIAQIAWAPDAADLLRLAYTIVAEASEPAAASPTAATEGNPTMTTTDPNTTTPERPWPDDLGDHEPIRLTWDGGSMTGITLEVRGGDRLTYADDAGERYELHADDGVRVERLVGDDLIRAEIAAHDRKIGRRRIGR